MYGAYNVNLTGSNPRKVGLDNKRRIWGRLWPSHLLDKCRVGSRLLNSIYIQRHPYLYKVVNSIFETLPHSASIQYTAHLIWTNFSETLTSTSSTKAINKDNKNKVLALNAHFNSKRRAVHTDLDSVMHYRNHLLQRILKYK